MNWATEPQGQCWAYCYSTVIQDTLALIPGSAHLDTGYWLLEGGHPISYPRDTPNILRIKDSFHPLSAMNLLPVLLQDFLC